jgi:putative DNA primase/helicase
MTLRPHRPEDMLDRVIPYNYLPKASCPKWERVLEEWLPNPQDRAALRAFFGYILLPQAIYKKALMVYGPPNTGKSIACSIAVALSGGSRFTCSIKPSDMGDPRKVAPIKGKALNLVADLSSDELVSDGGFKQLVSSGDTINIDEKFKPAEAYVPTAKHIFATNNLPHVNDASDAVFDRLMILPFSQQVPKEDRDPMLKEKLVDEMPGIILWALEGAVELFASQGKWPENLSSEEIIANMAEDSNPILEFISESGFIAPAPDAQPKDYIKRSDFCNLFRIWHVSNGGRRWTNRAIISRLRAQGVNVDYKLEGVRRLPGWSLSSQGSVQLNLNL